MCPQRLKPYLTNSGQRIIMLMQSQFHLCFFIIFDTVLRCKQYNSARSMCVTNKVIECSINFIFYSVKFVQVFLFNLLRLLSYEFSNEACVQGRLCHLDQLEQREEYTCSRGVFSLACFFFCYYNLNSGIQRALPAIFLDHIYTSDVVACILYKIHTIILFNGRGER